MADVIAGLLRFRYESGTVQYSADNGVTWMPVGHFGGLRFGGFLTNTDQTIQPGTDKASLYILLPGVLTANHVLTVGTTGANTNDYCKIVRMDKSAFTYTIQNPTPTTLHTTTASSTVDIGYNLNFSAGNWINWGSREFLQGP